MTEIASAQSLMGTNLGSNATLFTTTTTAQLAAKQMGRTLLHARFSLSATQAEVVIGYVDSSRYPNGATVVSVSFTSAAGVAASDTDYWTYLVKRYTAAGASGATILSTTTKAADLNSLAALTGVSLTTATTPAIGNTTLAVGAPITITATKSASGPTHDLLVEIVLEAL